MAVLAPQTALPPPVHRRRHWLPLVVKVVVLLAVLAGLAWLAEWGYNQITNPAASIIPTARVRRGTVTMRVYADGPLQGSRTEELTAPHVAGGQLSITTLLPPGTLVKPGEVVVAFDTSQQQYNLEVAKNSLAIAQQNVIEAKANAAATEQEDRYAIVAAKDNVRKAALTVQQDPILAKIDAETNVLALGTAKATLAQLEHNFASQQSTDQATIAIQQAAVRAARVQAQIARRNIAAMTLRAKQGGYMQIMPNTMERMFFQGMPLPDWQVGDTPHPGMMIAEIPDTQHWQVMATINDLDVGHLRPSQPARIQFVGLPGRVFRGRMLYLGGMSGPPWNRHVDAAIQLRGNSPQLHAGMTAKVIVTTAVLHNVLWVPAQAVFHVQGGGGFATAPGRGGKPGAHGRFHSPAAAGGGFHPGGGAKAFSTQRGGFKPGAAGAKSFFAKRGGFKPGAAGAGGTNAPFHGPMQFGAGRRGLPFSPQPHAPGSDYVYLKTSNGFVRHNVTILRESESKVVLSGLHVGDVIALANPEQNGGSGTAKKKPASAMQAISGAHGGRP